MPAVAIANPFELAFGNINTSLIACLQCSCALPQERYSDALDYSIRAEEALVAALGDNHPNVATILNNRATLLMEQVIATKRTV